ncbi:hypothetical protein GIB67_024662 [Kingdonia uniflora]|uniref:ATP-dependent helicase ATRX n=1 Tax=Kingdonia uniflora TaxID=39325 RepID=A0A7J7LP44_9MAGN|nr:hypothetical protein GIB67_024662 [Kingdonia uniflora]
MITDQRLNMTGIAYILRQVDQNGFVLISFSVMRPLHARLTDAEIEELISELVEVESKAAEAQESLEAESLARVENDVREELAADLCDKDLDEAVTTEMESYIENWEATLDELETESAHLVEQLDGSGIDLPSLYKWIESQVPNGCSTDAWKNRTHWVGAQVTNDITESIADAEKYLQTQRPVRKKHGKLLEEGASGFLGKRLGKGNDGDTSAGKDEGDWKSFNEIIQSNHISEAETSYGGKHWASVYLASTPQQAANLGLKLPGVDEVDEIDDIEGNSSDPFYADAIANEKEIDLSEEQKKNFRKVNEEEDANMVWKLQLHLKRRRQRIRSKQDSIGQVADVVNQFQESILEDSIISNGCSPPVLCEHICGSSEKVPDADNGDTSKDLMAEGTSVIYSNELDKETPMTICTSSVLSEASSFISPKSRGEKRLHTSEDIDVENKRSRTVIIDSDDEAHVGVDESTMDKTYQCTACTEVLEASEVNKHPLLKVIICKNCKCFVEEKMLIKDPDCSECYCGWCGRCKDLIRCIACEILICITCIKRNIGEERLSEYQTDGWHCCCCSPSLLQRLTVECKKAVVAKGLVISSTNSDSELSNSDISAPIRTKRRRKKKIRRILTDAELGEETKKKIAIEKERQEHLKSLKVQYNANSWTVNTESSIGIALDGASIEVLGDATKGYIVNVVREKNEESVRIPPSISAKLKPHQISGIRFMWENIIQSVSKTKSGDRGLGCILAHTMGLGKTFQVIALLYTCMRSVDLGIKSALIVTPVNVIHNWWHEFMKWRPEELKPLRVLMLDKDSRERRLELLKKWRVKGGVLLIGYESFRNLSLGKNVKDRDTTEIRDILQDGPDILICDEAHIIKNPKADVTLALKQVTCQRRVALTGSPLQNNLMEYYCMVDFVREGFLGSSHEFRNRQVVFPFLVLSSFFLFQNPIENGQLANSTSKDVKVMSQRSHILHEQLKGFVQRLGPSVVSKDLPPKTVNVLYVNQSSIQRKLCRRFIDKVCGDKIARMSFFAGYKKLSQILTHPGLLQFAKERRPNVSGGNDAVENFLVEDSSSDDNVACDALIGERQRKKNDSSFKRSDNGLLHEDWWKDLLPDKSYKDVDLSGKMALTLDILLMSAAAGDKTLVFSHHLATLDLIEHYLASLPRHEKEGKCWKRDKDWYRLDGSTEPSERQKLVEKFCKPTNTRVKCTLISTKAGSLGINLPAANRVIIVDGSWNPTHDLQAIYRVWRYGQKKPVYAYRLMAHGTMEEKIYKRQVIKEGLSARVMDKQQIHRTMSKEEMLHLFDFGDDENSDTASQENRPPSNQDMSGQPAILLKQKMPLHGSCSSDKVMECLLNRHHPRWIKKFHEHEILLQENEDEKLSKEEQDMAWEIFRQTIVWEDKRTPLNETTVTQKPPPVPNANIPPVPPPVPNVNIPPVPPPVTNAIIPQVMPESSKSRSQPKGKSWTQPMQRKCTNLSHLLTLRSQGTKPGCSTVCGECGQEISW